MRRIPLMSAALALSSLAGCVYDYAPEPPYHETTYSYSSPAPAYYYAPPPTGVTTVVVYDRDYRWHDYGWYNYARDKGWEN